MVDYDIQMKKNTDGEWNNHYPFTKTTNVLDVSSSSTLDKILGGIQKKLTDFQTLLDKFSNKQNRINVRDFGAKGDGVTDDTQAIQNAINSIGRQRQTIFFPSTNGNHYSVTSLTIPSTALVSRYQGEGDARIYFTDKIGFHIKGEFQIFDNLSVWHKGSSHADVTIFNDEREYKRLDFDISLQYCNFAYASKVVSTWGRGVFFNNCDFNDITGHFIYLTVKRESELEFGDYNMQKYRNGYRGYVIRNSRFHYCNGAVVMQTINDTEKVVQGVFVSNNFIEGGIGYYKGFVRNMVFKNNNHIQAETTRGALFEFDGFVDIDIDVKISGAQSNYDGVSRRINRLIESTEYGEHMKLTGSVRGVKKHVITMYNGGASLVIDLICTDIVGDTYSPSLLKLTGSKTFDGLLIKGIFLSQHDNTIVIDSDNQHTIYNLNHSGLMIRGQAASVTNIV